MSHAYVRVSEVFWVGQCGYTYFMFGLFNVKDILMIRYEYPFSNNRYFSVGEDRDILALMREVHAMRASR